MRDSVWEINSFSSMLISFFSGFHMIFVGEKPLGIGFLWRYIQGVYNENLCPLECPGQRSFLTVPFWKVNIVSEREIVGELKGTVTLSSYSISTTFSPMQKCPKLKLCNLYACILDSRLCDSKRSGPQTWSLILSLVNDKKLRSRLKTFLIDLEVPVWISRP